MQGGQRAEDADKRMITHRGRTGEWIGRIGRKLTHTAACCRALIHDRVCPAHSRLCDTAIPWREELLRMECMQSMNRTAADAGQALHPLSSNIQAACMLTLTPLTTLHH
jgi:hypothetical protein